MPPVIILCAVCTRGAKLAGQDDPAAANARRHRLRQAADMEGPLRRELGEGRRLIGQQLAVDRVLDQPDIVLAGDLDDRLAPLQRHDRQRRVLQRRDQEGDLRVLLRAQPLEILGIGAVLVAADQHAAPADQIGAARDRRIGQLFVGDLVAGRGHRGDDGEHGRMRADRRDDRIGLRRPVARFQPSAAGLLPGCRPHAGIVDHLVGMRAQDLGVSLSMISLWPTAGADVLSIRSLPGRAGARTPRGFHGRRRMQSAGPARGRPARRCRGRLRR